MEGEWQISKPKSKYEDVLCFNIDSEDDLPGKGPKEKVRNPAIYRQLGQIKNWRQILSNLYLSPISVNNITFNSVEEYRQEMKKQASENPQVDGAGWHTIKDQITEEALRIKFTGEFAQILRFTNTAQLHFLNLRSNKTERQFNLEKIRQEL